MTKKERIELSLAEDAAAELIHALLGDGFDLRSALEAALHPRDEGDEGDPAGAIPESVSRGSLASAEGERYGYWQVDGASSRAVVRASSAAEAIDRAEKSGLVAHWEMATATFVGPIYVGPSERTACND